MTSVTEQRDGVSAPVRSVVQVYHFPYPETLLGDKFMDPYCAWLKVTVNFLDI